MLSNRNSSSSIIKVMLLKCEHLNIRIVNISVRVRLCAKIHLGSLLLFLWRSKRLFEQVISSCGLWKCGTMWKIITNYLPRYTWIFIKAQMKNLGEIDIDFCKQGIKQTKHTNSCLTFLSNTAKAASAALEAFFSSAPLLRTGDGARTLSFCRFWILAQRSISFMIWRY